MNNLPPWLQSSADPTQISLSIESFGKFLIGVVAVFAVLKGLDVGAATSEAQQFIDQGATIAASGFTLYQALMTLYGLVRKLFMRSVLPAASATLAPAAPVISASDAQAALPQAASVPADWETQALG